MLKSIFYARFHPERGPDILHQHPAGSVSRSASAAGGLSSSISSANGLSLLPFSSISAYVIPPHELSNRSLAMCAQGFRVLGFPISIEGEGYERNRFVFNVCFVVEEREEVRCWEGVVGKMARFMKCLEIEGEGGVLRREEREVDERVARGEDEHEGLVGRVLREVFEQLNAYAECCVWVSAMQVLNLRLEKSVRTTERPKKVRAWDVPLLIRELPDQQGWTWDLVLEKVHPFVNGVNHVKRIARLADVDMKLVKKAVWELVLHERVMLLDIFHFQALYALTGAFALFVGNFEVIDECREYVAIDPKDGMFASVLDKQVIDESSGVPDRATILELYSILKPGLSVADLCLAHQSQLANIDVRRFITFGVIKGFLKRMHKYALALDPPDMQAVPQTTVTDIDKAWRKAALSSGWATPPTDAVTLQEKLETEEERARQEATKLVKFLDGNQCLDQICVEMGMHEKEVFGKVKSGKYGEVVVFCR